MQLFIPQVLKTPVAFLEAFKVPSCEQCLYFKKCGCVAGGESLALCTHTKAEVCPWSSGCNHTPVRCLSAEKRLRCVFGKCEASRIFLIWCRFLWCIDPLLLACAANAILVT